jgi:hypothetical protein
LFIKQKNQMFLLLQHINYIIYAMHNIMVNSLIHKFTISFKGISLPSMSIQIVGISTKVNRNIFLKNQSVLINNILSKVKIRLFCVLWWLLKTVREFLIRNSNLYGIWYMNLKNVLEEVDEKRIDTWKIMWH